MHAQRISRVDETGRKHRFSEAMTEREWCIRTLQLLRRGYTSIFLVFVKLCLKWSHFARHYLPFDKLSARAFCFAGQWYMHVRLCLRVCGHRLLLRLSPRYHSIVRRLLLCLEPTLHRTIYPMHLHLLTLSISRVLQPHERQ